MSKEKDSANLKKLIEEAVGSYDGCDDESGYEDGCECDEGFDFLPLDTTGISDLRLDKEEFVRGIKECSFLCGQITALANVGIPPESSIEYLVGKTLNSKALESNEKITKMNADATIEAAKYGMAAVKEQQI